MKLNPSELIKTVQSTKDIIQNTRLQNQVTQKGDFDFVTQADLNVQEYLHTYLKGQYGDFTFIAEEQPGKAQNIQGAAFILDPIDGTTNLLKGYNHCAVSLAYAKDGEVVFGVVYNPFTNETYTAEKGSGAYLNGQKIQASSTEMLSECLMTVGTCPYDRTNAAVDFNVMLSIFLDCADIRRSGSSALDLCYLASGKSEGYFERCLKPWDYSAGMLILQEAGGIVTDWKNGPLSLTSPSNVAAAANPKIHAYLLEKLAGI